MLAAVVPPNMAAAEEAASDGLHEFTLDPLAARLNFAIQNGDLTPDHIEYQRLERGLRPS